MKPALQVTERKGGGEAAVKVALSTCSRLFSRVLIFDSSTRHLYTDPTGGSAVMAPLSTAASENNRCTAGGGWGGGGQERK